MLTVGSGPTQPDMIAKNKQKANIDTLNLRITFKTPIAHGLQSSSKFVRTNLKLGLYFSLSIGEYQHARRTEGPLSNSPSHRVGYLSVSRRIIITFSEFSLDHKILNCYMRQKSH